MHQHNESTRLAEKSRQHLGRASASAPAGHGLVEHYQTSLQNKGWKTIDARGNRLRRMRSGLRTAAPLAHASAYRPGFREPTAWMLTVTYAEAGSWQPCDVSECLKKLRRWIEGQGHQVAGYWCAEMQDKRYRLRGELAVHYHIIVWLPHGVDAPKLDREGLWPHGMTRRDRVSKSAEGYLLKYATKGTEAPLPKGARLFGNFGLRLFRHQYTWLRRPAWMGDRVSIGDQCRRVKGGGWINLTTGEMLRSPFEVLFSRGCIYYRRRQDGSEVDLSVQGSLSAEHRESVQQLAV